MALATTTVAAMALASAAIGAAASVSQGMAAKKQANFSATVAQQQADRERLQAANDSEDYRREQSRVLAARRAAQGASGVDAGSGSSLLTSEDMAGEIELNALRIKNGGEVRATRAEQFASLQRASGKNAQTAGFMRAGSSLLSGAVNAYGE
tara:strand:- start:206 stop:661 length:456 start_codon:yes stop_codon:yes gene_type:complete